MKFRILTYLLVVLFIPNLVSSQDQAFFYPEQSPRAQSDVLSIERASGHKVTLSWPFNKNVKTQVDWQQLLSDFQTDFKKVTSAIPEYKFYNINYVQNETLVVEEVKGRETYAVNENESMDYIKSNVCYLTGDKLKLSIEFNDHSELEDSILKDEIEEAIAVIKNKFYVSKVSPENHFYDVSSKSLIDNKNRDLKFFIPIGARVGLTQDRPYIDLRTGLGLSIGKQLSLNLNWNVQTRYNDQLDKSLFNHYLGVYMGPPGTGIGSEFSVLIKSSRTDFEEFNKLFLRYLLSYRMKNGMQLGAEYYLRENGGVVFGFNIGYGF